MGVKGLVHPKMQFLSLITLMSFQTRSSSDNKFIFDEIRV